MKQKIFIALLICFSIPSAKAETIRFDGYPDIVPYYGPSGPLTIGLQKIFDEALKTQNKYLGAEVGQVRTAIVYYPTGALNSRFVFAYGNLKLCDDAKARRKAKEDCDEHFGPVTTQCRMTVSWNGVFSANTFTLTINPANCPAFAKISSQAASITMQPFDQSSVDYSDVRWATR